MWHAVPSMNSRLDEPPWEKFWLWKLEGVLRLSRIRELG